MRSDWMSRKFGLVPIECTVACRPMPSVDRRMNQVSCRRAVFVVCDVTSNQVIVDCGPSDTPFFVTRNSGSFCTSGAGAAGGFRCVTSSPVFWSTRSVNGDGPEALTKRLNSVVAPCWVPITCFRSTSVVGDRSISAASLSGSFAAASSWIASIVVPVTKRMTPDTMAAAPEADTLPATASQTAGVVKPEPATSTGAAANGNSAVWNAVAPRTSLSVVANVIPVATELTMPPRPRASTRSCEISVKSTLLVVRDFTAPASPHLTKSSYAGVSGRQSKRQNARGSAVKQTDGVDECVPLKLLPWYEVWNGAGARSTRTPSVDARIVD